MSIILRTVGLGALEVWVIGRRYGDVIRYRVTTDNESASMNTCAAHRSLQHLRVFDGVCQLWVGRTLCFSQLRHIFDGVGQIHLRPFWQTVWDSLAKSVRHRQRQFFHTSDILNGILRCHGGISDDMGTVLMSILVHHPLQHLTTTIVVEVGIDIGQ